MKHQLIFSIFQPYFQKIQLCYVFLLLSIVMYSTMTLVMKYFDSLIHISNSHMPVWLDLEKTLLIGTSFLCSNQWMKFIISFFPLTNETFNFCIEFGFGNHGSSGLNGSFFFVTLIWFMTFVKNFCDFMKNSFEYLFEHDFETYDLDQASIFE